LNVIAFFLFPFFPSLFSLPSSTNGFPSLLTLAGLDPQAARTPYVSR
jgi:hypothetical protein